LGGGRYQGEVAQVHAVLYRQATVAFELVGHRIAGNGEHPAFEGRAFPEGGPVLDHPFEGRLQQIFGRGGGVPPLEQESINGPTVALVQLGELVQIAVAYGPHEVFVGVH